MRQLRRIWAFFEPDSTWQRPVPQGAWRRDLRLMPLWFLLASFALELARSARAFERIDMPVAEQHLVLWLALVPLALRRRRPITVMLVSYAVLLGLSGAEPTLAVVWSTQAASAVAIYSATAWTRDRRFLVVALVLVALSNLVYAAFTFATATALADIRHATSVGLMSPVTAFVVYWVIVNQLYIWLSAIAGQVVWRGVRQRAELAAQNRQLSAQARTIREQARVQERLRIARELHDVVAHHVSVIGVQAAGARKVLHRDPPAAQAALGVVEESSRQAVGEMRSLLGTLRGRTPDSPPEDRAPEPRASDIGELVAGVEGVDVTYRVVQDRPDAVGDVPPGVGLALYRVTQEALANVRRHSTAVAADVTVRVAQGRTGPRYAEVEVLDDGRPRHGTSGSGLGLLGIRERIASLHGSAEIGPRPTGGYRVRVRFPLSATVEA